jgi:ketosteroid isomerase-like protein
MKRQILLLGLSFAICAFNPSAAQTKADPTTAKVTALEAKWNDAYKRNDAAGMTALLSDDFIITVEDGNTYSKSGYLAHTADSDLKVQISEMNDLKSDARQHRMQRRHYEKGSDGKPYESRDRFTDIWTKTPTGWQVIASATASPRINSVVEFLWVQQLQVG